MKSPLIGYKSKRTLALFILLIFIELVSAHKSAKKAKKEKELGKHPALGQLEEICSRVKIKRKKNSAPPRRGIEPRSPA